MAQVSTAYQRSLEDFGRRRFRKGHNEGIRQGRNDQTTMLCRQVSEKFGAETAEKLSALLDEMPESGRLLEAAIAVIACATAEEFLGRVRSASSA